MLYLVVCVLGASFSSGVFTIYLIVRELLKTRIFNLEIIALIFLVAMMFIAIVILFQDLRKQLRGQGKKDE